MTMDSCSVVRTSNATAMAHQKDRSHLSASRMVLEPLTVADYFTNGDVCELRRTVCLCPLQWHIGFPLVWRTAAMSHSAFRQWKQSAGNSIVSIYPTVIVGMPVERTCPGKRTCHWKLISGLAGETSVARGYPLYN